MTAFIEIDLEKITKDPLDLIVKHKDIVRHLRGNKIDGMEIRKMLNNSHGLKREWPIRMTKSEKEKRKQVDYAMRWTTDLIKSEITTDEEREFLCKMYNRLWHEFPSWEKGKTGGPVFKMAAGNGEGDAMSDKQMTGRQIASINNYILKFNKLYKKNDIFDLIAEIYEVTDMGKFTREQIKNRDKDNCLFLSILK